MIRSLYCILFFSVFFMIPVHSKISSSLGNGRAKFPMVMYAVPATDSNFEEVKSWGINYVHLYGLTSGPLTKQKLIDIQQYLDMANKYQLKVMVDLDGVTRIEKGQIEEMKIIVNTFKNHPAVGYWYLFDEPDNKKVSKDELRPFYDMIKLESPDVPIAICHAWTKNWSKYGDVQDILLHDIYPIKDEEFPNVKLENQSRFTDSAMRMSSVNTIMPVIQFFNWKSISKPGDLELDGASINQLRYPNLAEFRYLCFSTLSQGVKGLGFYSFARYKMISSDWSEMVVNPVLNEFVSFTEKINSENMQIKKTGSYKSDGYLYSYWTSDKGSYYIIINSAQEVRDIKIIDKNIRSAEKLKFWGSSRVVDFVIESDFVIFKNLKPWEVVILEDIKI